MMAIGPLATSGPALAQDAPQNARDLPSWRDGQSKSDILAFLQAVTAEGSPDFVPPEARTAVFDNDGTLWAEEPVMPEVAFALARLEALAPQHPEWATEEPFAAALKGDRTALARGGIPALVKIVVATQAGTTTEAFRALVTEWLRGAHHPRFQKPYVDLVYQPMLEILRLFTAHGFRCFVVSGGGIEFLRAWTGTSYGLLPERVIGSTLELQYHTGGERAQMMQLPRVTNLTNGPQKATAIATIIGQRPLAAFGNADGDYEMLQYVTTGEGRRLGMIVHHDDADREYAYDRTALVGKLDRGLDDAAGNGWRLISMRQDWATVFPG